MVVMRKKGNLESYFEELEKIESTTDLMVIVDDLKQALDSHSHEFSLGSKLLHTRNPSKPIYDSKVRTYLTTCENVDLWWQNKGASSKLNEADIISHDWETLLEWYDTFIKSERGKSWIEWFDDVFPEGKNISAVKKIDFIIFATN